MNHPKLYKCEYDVGSHNSEHYSCHIVAQSITDAAREADNTRRKNIEITEIDTAVTIAGATNNE